MPKVMECPYFRWEEGLKLRCEPGVISFGDKESRTIYTDKYCNSVKDYQRCTLAQNLSDKYERETVETCKDKSEGGNTALPGLNEYIDVGITDRWLRGSSGIRKRK